MYIYIHIYKSVARMTEEEAINMRARADRKGVRARDMGGSGEERGGEILSLCFT